MSYELRYRGELLGFYETEEGARAHAKEHHGLGVKDKLDHHVEDEESLSIAPRKPVELYCGGSLVDTFDSREGAQARIAAIQNKRKERGRRPIAVAAFWIVDTAAGDRVHARHLAREQAAGEAGAAGFGGYAFGGGGTLSRAGVQP